MIPLTKAEGMALSQAFDWFAAFGSPQPTGFASLNHPQPGAIHFVDGARAAHRHQEALSLSLGLAQVHSMYLGKIVERSTAENVDPHALINAVGEIDRLDASEAVLDSAVKSAHSRSRDRSFSEGGFFVPIQSDDPLDLLANAENIARKIALPCRIWLAEPEAANSAEIVQTSKGIELRVRGDAQSLVRAVTQQDTEIVLCPGSKIDKSDRPFGEKTKVTEVNTNPDWGQR